MPTSFSTNPTIAQWWLLGATIVCFLAAFWSGLRRLHTAPTALVGAPMERPRFSTAGAAAVGLGVVFSLGLLAWRAALVRRATLPLSDNFDAFVVLGLMLAAVHVYFGWTHRLRGIALFLLPMVAAVMLLGGLLSLFGHRSFDTTDPWTVVHVLSVLTGSACFAAGCVGGFVYLLADRQLRRKGDPDGRFKLGSLGLPPLARMERFNQHAILIGFPLLTLAMITGVLQAVEQPGSLGSFATAWPKVTLAVAAWLLYAPLLHRGLAPAFRGQRAAWLSIIGFMLLIGVFIAVTWMPG